jgi:hypothetical protein
MDTCPRRPLPQARHHRCQTSPRANPLSHPPLPTPATKTALITGITGQDGSYLAELLLNEGYQLHWIKRRATS